MLSPHALVTLNDPRAAFEAAAAVVVLVILAIALVALVRRQRAAARRFSHYNDRVYR